MALTLILARADNGVIGRDGGLPWRLPADLKRFKALTMGGSSGAKPMIMGRKTFEGFPAPLPGRRHIVLTRDQHWQAAGAEVVHSVDDALALAGADAFVIGGAEVVHSVDDALALAGADAFVIGGAEIFALFEPLADRIELTEVHCEVTGDVSVPAFVGWREIAREPHAADGERPAYSFVTLDRP